MVPITHLIHSSKAPRDTTKDFKLANATDGCHIVSPDWLFKCEQSGRVVDEKAYPPIIAPSRGLEMDFTNNNSNSLPLVSTMGLEILSEPKIKVEQKRPEVSGEDDDEARGLHPDEHEDEDLGTIYHPSRNPEPTPPTSAPESTLPLTLSARRNPNPSVKPASGEIQGTPEPPNTLGEKAPISIGNILGKLGKCELTTAMDKRRKPRGKLQGKAAPSLSSFSNFSRASSVSSNRAESVPPAQHGNRPEVENPKRKDPNTPNKQHEAELPAPSQAIRYEDPEAEKERKSVRAKLSGDAFGVETPKPTRSAAKRIKTAVDMEGSGSVTRRTKRNK